MRGTGRLRHWRRTSTASSHTGRQAGGRAGRHMSLSFDRGVCFDAEWFDESRGEVRAFKLYYYEDGSLQVMEGSRTFLAKTHMSALSPSDFYVNGALNIFSRKFILVGPGDRGTAKYLQQMKSRGIAFLDGRDKVTATAKLLGLVQKTDTGIVVARVRMMEPSPDLPYERPVAVEVVLDERRGGWRGWMALLETLQDEIAALEVTIHASDTPEEAISNIHQTFGEENGAIPPRPMSGVPDNIPCTLVVIKPHILKAGKLGEVLAAIAGLDQFAIHAMEMMVLDKVAAEELWGPYKGVVPHYEEMMTHLTSGAVLALVLSSGSGDVVEAFREVCGPDDPEVARALRPKSLRAMYGMSRERNAVYCTDLPDDGRLECKYLIDVVAKSLA
jgi:nucleoside-diphosphate kinase